MAGGVPAPGGATPGGGLAMGISELNRHIKELILVRKQTAQAQAARSEHAQGRMRMAHAAFAIERAGQQVGGAFGAAGSALGAGIQAARSFGPVGAAAAFGIEAIGFAANQGAMNRRAQAELDALSIAPMDPMQRFAGQTMKQAELDDRQTMRLATNFAGDAHSFLGNAGVQAFLPNFAFAGKAAGWFGTDSAQNEATRRIAEARANPQFISQQFMHNELSQMAAQGVPVSELSPATLKQLQELNDRRARQFVWVDQQYGTFGSQRGASQ